MKTSWLSLQRCLFYLLVLCIAQIWIGRLFTADKENHIYRWYGTGITSLQWRFYIRDCNSVIATIPPMQPYHRCIVVFSYDMALVVQRYFDWTRNLIKYGVVWVRIWSTDHNKILRTLRQCNWREVYKNAFWWAEYMMNKRITKWYWISNLIKMSLVGRRLIVPWNAICVWEILCFSHELKLLCSSYIAVKY